MANPIKGVKLDITLTTIIFCWHYSNLIKPKKELELPELKEEDLLELE